MYDAYQITLALGGRWQNNYGIARCPAHDDHNPSLSISNSAEGKLLLFCHAGCKYNIICLAMLAKGLKPSKPSSLYNETMRARALDQEEANIKKRRRAQNIWDAAEPVEGSIAQRYLATRGINGSLPETLRFHPRSWHLSGNIAPAMIARIEGIKGAGIHQTFLKPDGAGKAEFSPNKTMLGKAGGGAVRLTQDDGPLVVCEGIENGLSLASGILERPGSIWATLSAPGMKSVKLPETPGELIIATDGDNTGRTAANDLSLRARAAGWRVSLCDSGDGLDWNDRLLEARHVG